MPKFRMVKRRGGVSIGIPSRNPGLSKTQAKTVRKIAKKTVIARGNVAVVLNWASTP